MTLHEEKAAENFMAGYNCSQSVFLAFTDLMEIDEKMAARVSSAFGGGMGRMREVCGAVSGMFMVLGVLYGYDSPKVFEEKKQLYERVQALAKTYKDENGSIICRELLAGINNSTDPTPEKRTEEYYKKRPCVKKVAAAARILDEMIAEIEKEKEETSKE